MGFNSPKNESIRRPRPFGLWLLATINVFVALFIAANSFWLLSILYHPVPQYIVFGPHAEIVSWIGVVLAIGLMLATTGVLAGRAPARTILFGILFIYKLVCRHSKNRNCLTPVNYREHLAAMPFLHSSQFCQAEHPDSFELRLRI